MRTLTILGNMEYSEVEDIPEQAIFSALGYLAQWAISGYDTASIFIHKDGEMTATYTQSNDPQKVFVLGANWQTDHYSFNS